MRTTAVGTERNRLEVVGHLAVLDKRRSGTRFCRSGLASCHRVAAVGDWASDEATNVVVSRYNALARRWWVDPCSNGRLMYLPSKSAIAWAVNSALPKS